MCGIFGSISKNKIDNNKIKKLVIHSQQRGKDSSGLIYYNDEAYQIVRADFEITKLIKKVNIKDSKIVCGHSRLITNGLSDNQPVAKKNIAAIHNGIIVNEKEIWDSISVKRELTIDSETIVAIAEEHLNNLEEVSTLPSKILAKCNGIVACALVLPAFGKLLLFSNNGSLYIGESETDQFFASERYGLEIIGCTNIRQIIDSTEILDIPKLNKDFTIINYESRVENLIPEFVFNSQQEQLLEYKKINIKRCTKCVLPETMPFIKFDEQGV
jgi:glucosamine 6-phosphate synthetase-like amidotransferase/phosphosugar isomerase protein